MRKEGPDEDSEGVSENGGVCQLIAWQWHECLKAFALFFLGMSAGGAALRGKRLGRWELAYASGVLKENMKAEEVHRRVCSGRCAC